MWWGFYFPEEKKLHKQLMKIIYLGVVVVVVEEMEVEEVMEAEIMEMKLVS